MKHISDQIICSSFLVTLYKLDICTHNVTDIWAHLINFHKGPDDE